MTCSDGKRTACPFLPSSSHAPMARHRSGHSAVYLKDFEGVLFLFGGNYRTTVVTYADGTSQRARLLQQSPVARPALATPLPRAELLPPPRCCRTVGLCRQVHRVAPHHSYQRPHVCHLLCGCRPQLRQSHLYLWRTVPRPRRGMYAGAFCFSFRLSILSLSSFAFYASSAHARCPAGPTEKDSSSRPPLPIARATTRGFMTWTHVCGSAWTIRLARPRATPTPLSRWTRTSSSLAAAMPNTSPLATCGPLTSAPAPRVRCAPLRVGGIT